MSNEVKRYNIVTAFIKGPGIHIEPTLPVVLASDHDRIVSGLSEALSFVMKQDTEKLETIARQSRVIEKLREQRDEGVMDDYWPYEKKQIEVWNAEIAAIERGGEK